jgi:hypothetical protein
MANQIEFARGDGAYHKFSIPAANWTAGGKLFFTAKPIFDDDNTDAAATISNSWADTSVTDVTINGIAYKQYNCYFPPSATNGIASNGADSATYFGEFEYVPTTNIPVTFPANNVKLECIVYFDITRKIA